MHKILIGLIVLLAISSTILNLTLIKEVGEDLIEEVREDLIEEDLRVCYMPRDCFEIREEYINQFPGKEEPEKFTECLVYCFN